MVIPLIQGRSYKIKFISSFDKTLAGGRMGKKSKKEIEIDEEELEELMDEEIGIIPTKEEISEKLDEIKEALQKDKNVVRAHVISFEFDDYNWDMFDDEDLAEMVLELRDLMDKLAPSCEFGRKMDSDECKKKISEFEKLYEKIKKKIEEG